MHRSLTDKWLGGVLGGIGQSMEISVPFLRILFLVLFLGIGGLSFGVGWGAVVVIYLLCWMILPVR